MLLTSDDLICPHCGGELEINETVEQSLKHLCFGPDITAFKFRIKHMKCKCCQHSVMQHLPFKADNHLITKDRENYITDLLVCGCYTLVEIAKLTKVSRHIIKDIDLKRLKALYTDDDNKLIKPKKQDMCFGLQKIKRIKWYMTLLSM